MLNGKSVDFAQTKTYYMPFLWAFHGSLQPNGFQNDPMAKIRG